MRIVAIDFETANHSRLSACSLGLAIFDDGQLIEAPYWLIKPPKGHAWFIPEWTEDIHGLTWSDVQQQPDFGEIAHEVLRHLTSADVVVAHNASFDLSVLHQLLEHFKMETPVLHHCCTRHLAQKTWPHLPNHQLSTVAKHLGIDLNHHHAQSDAIAAGRVMLAANQSDETLCTQSESKVEDEPLSSPSEFK